jgi:hypothetical protein
MSHSQGEKKINTLRRKLCLFSGLAPIAASSSAISRIAGSEPQRPVEGAFNNNQYRSFYLAWKNAFVQAPFAYITERNEIHSAMKSSEIVEFDFINGNVIDINSFILSKYEAAVIAHIGSYA